MYLCSEFSSSFETNSKKIEEFAKRRAFLLALLNEAAVPSGERASSPPSETRNGIYRETMLTPNQQAHSRFSQASYSNRFRSLKLTLAFSTAFRMISVSISSMLGDTVISSTKSSSVVYSGSSLSDSQALRSSPCNWWQVWRKFLQTIKH